VRLLLARRRPIHSRRLSTGSARASLAYLDFAVTSREALEYVLDRLLHETLIRPQQQPPEVLARKLEVIRTLSALRYTQPVEN
jgi:hypothetical protein